MKWEDNQSLGVTFHLFCATILQQCSITLFQPTPILEKNLKFFELTKIVKGHFELVVFYVPKRNIFVYKNFPTFKIIIICNMASFMNIIKSYLFLHYRPNILSKYLLWSAMGLLWLIEAFRISLLLRCLLSLFSEFRWGRRFLNIEFENLS